MTDLEFARKYYSLCRYTPMGVLSAVEKRQLGRLLAAGRAEKTHDGLFRIVDGDWLISDILSEVDRLILNDTDRPLPERVDTAGWGNIAELVFRRQERLRQDVSAFLSGEAKK